MRPNQISFRLFAAMFSLMVVLALAPSGLATERAEWLHQARWGVMTHYLGAPPSTAGGAELTAEMWNKQVDAFDVPGLVDQLASTGGQLLAVYDRPKLRALLCAQRHLRSDRRNPSQQVLTAGPGGRFVHALKARNIRLMVYLPSGAPAADVVARKKLQWRWGQPGDWQYRASRWAAAWSSSSATGRP